ncbi:TonB-dependent receptor [Bizionia saleffrena]|uniref:TonB-dependent receptor n=1 Tax=Bizionia saleffrena TaxID=291189 RepID=A0A8H2QFV6_9FLAO|nr:TonB-dependent receptor [Bizionia saleffrena]TYB76764.1 TonB-dependent receptor [Bizionia saleffrena]
MKYFYTLLLFLAATHLYSQQNITGIIIDQDTNHPIEFATVYIPKLEKGTTTNQEGGFTLKGIPLGTQNIIVSIVGYQTASQNIILPLNTPLTMALKPSAIEMEEVIISTPFHKLQSENVMKVERANIKALQQQGAMNLSEGLSTIAGVESVSTGVSIGKPVIRGLSSNRVLVYAQGIRLENQQFGDEHGLGISDAGIESVEVIKGPASLLYGSDALGGVLYLNPERYASRNSSASNIEGKYFSNTKGYSTNAGYKSSGENLKFLFRGSLAEHSDYNTEDYRVTNTRFREQDFKAGIGYQNDGFKTDFRYNVNHSKLGIPEEIGEQSTNRAPLLPYQDLTNHIFSLKSTSFFKNSRLDYTFGYTYNDRKEFEEHHEHDDHSAEEQHQDDAYDHTEKESVLDPALYMKLKTANYDIKYNLPRTETIETIVGIQGMNQTNKNYGEEQLIPDATINDFGVLATSHIHFNAADLQLGVRFDTRDIKVNSGIHKSYNSFNGSVGVKTNLTENTVVRLNMASGFRAPNLAELTSNGSHEGTNRYEIGNSELQNEQNIQADLTLEYGSKHFEFFVNGFYNTINNYIYLTPNGTLINNDPVFLYLQEDASLYGGEIGFHLHPHPIHWLHLESSFETVTGKQDNGAYLPLIPANSLTNKIRVEFKNNQVSKGYAFVKLKSTFKQNNTSAFETTTDSYNLLSAGFGGEFIVFNTTCGVSLSGSNLTNKTYFNHLSRLKSDGIFNMGRSFNLGLTFIL